MERVDFLLDETQLKFLKKLPGTLSEHIRTAINNYIRKIQSEGMSASQSKGSE